MSDVAVIGAGAWGTALALQAHRAGRRTALWSRRALPGRSSPRLPDHALPEAIALGMEMPEAAAYVLAVPVQTLAEVASRLPADRPALVVCKGLETSTARLPLEVLAAVRGAVPAAVLTGPNFAHEVAAGLPAAAVVASGDPALRAAFAALLGSPSFRLYGNDDPVGAQLGGAAKNVMAIAAGAVIGAGLGENARAALVTRGLVELSRLVVALGGRAETVAGLSGLGDLLLTCTGPGSRNFRCGLALGRGQSLEQAVAESRGVIEGIATAPALMRRAAGVELPICAAVEALLAGRTTLADAIGALLSRPARDE
jgi:glycerol-3-phosphate dehydrogenase (NAD(P)+)